MIIIKQLVELSTKMHQKIIEISTKSFPGNNLQIYENFHSNFKAFLSLILQRKPVTNN